jgi:rRNA biogenesis protein RRP5
MGPIKRKSGPTNDSFVRSKKIGENDNRPLKRLRQEDAGSSQTTKRDGAGSRPNSTSIQVPKIAKAKEEDAAFPRGGASILTPLEHKQIHIDATRDVLFEQQTSSRTKDDDGEGEATTGPGTKKRKHKSTGKKAGEAKDAEDDHIRIEGLSYKVVQLLPIDKLLVLMKHSA